MIFVVDILYMFDKEEMLIFFLFGNLKLGEKVFEVVLFYFSKIEIGREISKVLSYYFGMFYWIVIGFVDERI